jgi:hypothetical protein
MHLPYADFVFILHTKLILSFYKVNDGPYHILLFSSTVSLLMSIVSFIGIGIIV